MVQMVRLELLEAVVQQTLVEVVVVAALVGVTEAQAALAS
jgi:hypothetical protein